MIKRIIKLFIIIGLLILLTNISRDFSDLTTSVLVDWHGKNELSEKPAEELLTGQKISGEFTAGENNLGIVSVKFINVYGGSNNDRLVFRLKEIGQNSWYYENYYYTDQFLSDSYFPFGFPPIAGSFGKIYRFEIESLYGLSGNALSLSASDPVFKAKYKFSKRELLADKKELLIFIVKKLGNYLSVYEVIAGLGIVIVSVALGKIKLLKLLKLPKLLKERVKRREDLIFTISIFLLTLIVAGYFSTIGIYPTHDGIMLKPAIDVASGKMLFRDTYTQYGGLSTLIQAFFIKIFGEYLIVIRLATASFYALSAVILYLVGKRIMAGRLAMLSCLLWIVTATYLKSYFLPWSSVYALFFQVLSLYLLMRFLENREWIYLFLSGTATALTFWCRQPVGVFLFGGYIVFFVFKLLKLPKLFRKKEMKTVLVFLGGFLVTNFIFFLWLFVNHALYDWFLQSVGFAYLFGRTIGIGRGLIRPITSLIPVYRPKTPFSYYSDVLWVILPLSCLFIFFKLIWQTRLRKLSVSESNLFALLLVSFSSWMQYFPVSERQHFYWAAAPMVGVMVYLLSRISAKVTPWQRRQGVTLTQSIFFLVLIYAVFSPVTSERLQTGWVKVNRKYFTLEKPSVLKNMRLSRYEAMFYGQMAQELDRYRQVHPEKKLVTKVPDALFLTFITDNENVHQLYLLNSSQAGQLYPDFGEKFNYFVKEKKPLIVSQSYDLIDGYCQLYIPDNYISMTVKAADEGKDNFKIVSFKAGPKAEIVIEVNPDLLVEDAYVEKYDNAQKIRRWTVKDIERYKKLSLESNLGKRYTFRLDEELKDGAKIIVKLLFAGSNCYVEKEVETNG